MVFLDWTQLFNPAGELGNWISSTTTNTTGDIVLTFGLVIFILITLIMLFKMPDFLVYLLLFAPVALFSTMSPEFNLFVGLGILLLASATWALWPAK